MANNCTCAETDGFYCPRHYGPVPYAERPATVTYERFSIPVQEVEPGDQVLIDGRWRRATMIKSPFRPISASIRKRGDPWGRLYLNDTNYEWFLWGAYVTVRRPQQPQQPQPQPHKD